MTKEELQKKYGNEQVFCVPTEALAALAQGSDPIFYHTDAVLHLMQAEGRFLLRAEVEQDEQYKQVIPYVLAEKEETVLTAQRLKGDPRLVGGYTLGMGGHVNPEDSGKDMRELLERCMLREMAEETTFEVARDMDSYALHPLSFVNVRNEVSRVHLCVPVRLRLKEEASVSIREVEKLRGQWMPKTELGQLSGKLEGWSEIALTLLLDAQV